MLRRNAGITLVLCGLAGCAAKPLLPGSDQVVLSKQAAAADCRFLAEVRGSQGNFWTAEFTSDANLIHGARNEVRNAARKLSANYVQIETEVISQNTASGSLGGAYSAIVIGNAFRCDAAGGPSV
jgi:hypothetical protein